MVVESPAPVVMESAAVPVVENNVDAAPPAVNGTAEEPAFKPEVPNLIRQLQGQIVEAGATAVTFNCEIKNATGVGWSFNGKALAPDDKYDIVMGDGGIVLTVKNVTTEDSGIYVCYGVNTDGRVTTVAYLSVRGKREPSSSSSSFVISLMHFFFRSSDPANPGPKLQFVTFPKSLVVSADSPFDIDCSFTTAVSKCKECLFKEKMP